MTNEEAVKMLRTMQRTVYLGNRKFEDAIECAIKALSEPLQPWEVLAAQAVLSQPEPHWILVTEDTLPEEERECWITPKTTSRVYRGVFTRHYGECHRTGFICDDGFMWLNTALAWMYCELPEPYKGVAE